MILVNFFDNLSKPFVDEIKQAFFVPQI